MKNSFIVLIIFFSFCLGGCPQEPTVETAKESSVRPVRYTLLKAEQQGTKSTFSGTAVADRESSLSFKVNGTVQSIKVKVGDKVHTGDLLAQLDKTDLKVDLDSSRSGLSEAKADAQSSQTAVYTSHSTYNRIQKLYENDNVSLSEFEQARGDYETAQARLQASKSRITTEKSKLKAAENQLKYTGLFAPFDGIINDSVVEENEEIASGASIFILSGLGNLEVNVNVSDNYISRIKKDMECQVTFPGLPETPFEGRVTEVPYAATDAPTYPVTIAIQTKDERLRPGMAAEVNFHFDTLQGKNLYAPVDAVGEEGGENFVFIIETTEDTKAVAKKRKVSLGALTEKGFLVKEGLTSGERVATSGLQSLLDGMAVKLLKDPIKEW
ncbi:MAG: efflux RND transporter periplasmic adaptor subunit [Desulfobacterium sp.]